jgi:hypothetical protein
MNYTRNLVCTFVLLVGCISSVFGQTPTPSSRLVSFSGSVRDSDAKPLTGTTNIVFSLYAERESSQALWLETQTVILDSTGTYRVLLGANSPGGVPDSFLQLGRYQWLGIQPLGQPEQRIQLANPTVIQHLHSTASCSTGSNRGNTCNISLTWPTAFVDTNYTVVCSAELGTGSNNSAAFMYVPTANRTTTAFVVTMKTLNSLTATLSGVDCVGMHN